MAEIRTHRCLGHFELELRFESRKSLIKVTLEVGPLYPLQRWGWG